MIFIFKATDYCFCASAQATQPPLNSLTSLKPLLSAMAAAFLLRMPAMQENTSGVRSVTDTWNKVSNFFGRMDRAAWKAISAFLLNTTS